MANRLVDKTSFRQVFQHATKDVTYYFPGHMAKGMKQLEKRMQDVDCVLEVHDARIPFSGRNPWLSDMSAARPRLLVLNKLDLADTRNRENVQTKLRQEGVTDVIYTNCKDQVHHTIKRVILPKIMKLIESQPRYTRADEESYNLAVIGVPNVGKSSLINALRREHIKKGKASRVGAVAGITRSVMEKIRVSNIPLVYVYDSPGILNPKVQDVEEGMKLALCGTLQDHLVGEDVIADYLLFWLNKHNSFKYVHHFGLPEASDDIYAVLAHIAKERNLIQRQKAPTGGYVLRPNFNHAAKIMLKEFREGNLGRFNLDKDCVRPKEKLLKPFTDDEIS